MLEAQAIAMKISDGGGIIFLSETNLAKTVSGKMQITSLRTTMSENTFLHCYLIFLVHQVPKPLFDIT